MRYRVDSGPKGSDDVSPKNKDRPLFKKCTSMDEALSWARHVEKDGRVPLLIEGDDGTRMDRRTIVDALRVGMREEVGGQLSPWVGAMPHGRSRASGGIGDPVPFGACAPGEMAPFDRDHVPVHQGPLFDACRRV